MGKKGVIEAVFGTGVTKKKRQWDVSTRWRQIPEILFFMISGGWDIFRGNGHTVYFYRSQDQNVERVSCSGAKPNNGMVEKIETNVVNIVVV